MLEWWFLCSAHGSDPYVICCEPVHHVVANLVTIRIGHERTSYVVSLGHERSSSAVCCIPSICGPRAGVIHRPAWCIHACGHDLLQEKATRSHRAAVPYCCLCDGEETLLLYASSGGGVAIFLRKCVYMMSSPRWRPVVLASTVMHMCIVYVYLLEFDMVNSIW